MIFGMLGRLLCVSTDRRAWLTTANFKLLPEQRQRQGTFAVGALHTGAAHRFEGVADINQLFGQKRNAVFWRCRPRTLAYFATT